MSGASPYAVLLPAASVAVFSKHADTCAAVAALREDWRFARIKIDVQTSDVVDAISHFQYNPSPEIVIIDTDVIDSSFTAQLEGLAASCSEGTNAVVVGPVNDVYLYRNLIGMGVSDYLVRPLRSDVVADVIARVLLEQKGSSDSQLIAVIGAKGGVGASTIAELIAFGLGEYQKQKTVLMDAAGGHSYLSVAFGMEPVTTLNEAARASVAQDQSALNRALQKYGTNLQILGSGNDRLLEETATPDQIEKVLDRLLAVTPYVVADLSGAMAAVQRMIIARAKHIFLVSQPTLSSLRQARSLLQEMKDMRGGQFDGIDLVINMAGFAPGAEVGRLDIEAAMEHKVNLTISYDPKMIVGAESQAKVLGTVKGAEKIIGDLLIRLNLSGQAPESQKEGGGGLFGGLLRRGR